MTNFCKWHQNLVMFSVFYPTRVRLSGLHLIWTQLFVENWWSDVRSSLSISYILLWRLKLWHWCLWSLYRDSMSSRPCGMPLWFYPSFVDVLTFGPRSVMKRSGLLVPKKFEKGWWWLQKKRAVCNRIQREHCFCWNLKKRINGEAAKQPRLTPSTI